MCSRRSLETLWTDESRKTNEEADDYDYHKLYDLRERDASSYHVVRGPTVLVPISVSSLTLNQRESESLRNTGNSFLWWKKAPETGSRLGTVNTVLPKTRMYLQVHNPHLNPEAFQPLALNIYYFLNAISESIFKNQLATVLFIWKPSTTFTASWTN